MRGHKSLIDVEACRRCYLGTKITIGSLSHAASAFKKLIIQSAKFAIPDTKRNILQNINKSFTRRNNLFVKLR